MGPALNLTAHPDHHSVMATSSSVRDRADIIPEAQKLNDELGLGELILRICVSAFADI